MRKTDFTINISDFYIVWSEHLTNQKFKKIIPRKISRFPWDFLCVVLIRLFADIC